MITGNGEPTRRQSHGLDRRHELHFERLCIPVRSDQQDRMPEVLKSPSDHHYCTGLDGRPSHHDENRPMQLTRQGHRRSMTVILSRVTAYYIVSDVSWPVSERKAHLFSCPSHLGRRPTTTFPPHQVRTSSFIRRVRPGTMDLHRFLPHPRYHTFLPPLPLTPSPSTNRSVPHVPFLFRSSPPP